MLNQNFQDPFVAIVIDPVRTISAGKVNLGAFRTYPKGKIIYRQRQIPQFYSNLCSKYGYHVLNLL